MYLSFREHLLEQFSCRLYDSQQHGDPLSFKITRAYSIKMVATVWISGLEKSIEQLLHLIHSGYTIVRLSAL